MSKLKSHQGLGIVALSGLLTLTAISARGDEATLLPNAIQYFMDANGKPLANGKVFMYTPSTTTPKATWTTASKSVLQPQPYIPLGISGKPASPIYGDGSYRQKVVDQFNNTIWDFNTASTGSGGGGTTPTVGDGLTVGSILPWTGLTAPPNYLFAAGQQIVRADYPLFFSTITITTNLVCTSGLNVLSGIADTQNIKILAPVEASCIPPGTTVTAVAANAVTISANATVSTATQATFFPYGNGNGSTTITMPELRGRVIAGRNNMGGTATPNLTTIYYGTSPDAMGAYGGLQTHSNTAAETGVHAHQVFANDPGHAHGVTGGTFGSTSTSTAVSAAGVQLLTGSTAITISSNTTGIILNSAAGGLGNANSTATAGLGQPHPIVQPTVTLNYIVKVLPDASTVVASGVASLGGMTGVLACGSGLTCGSQTISLTATTNPIIVGTTGVVGGTNQGLLINNGSIVGNIPTIAASTGTDVPFQITNSGTSSTAGTAASLYANLSGCASCDVAIQAIGGASPTGSIVSASGLTGGLTVGALGGSNLNLLTQGNGQITGDAYSYSFNVSGGASNNNIYFHNTFDGGSLNLRFFGKNTAGSQVIGAIINPGLSANTAGSEVGDIDFLIYRSGDLFSPVFCAAMEGTVGVEGFNPCNDNAFLLGKSGGRWKNVFSALGTFNSVVLPGSSSGNATITVPAAAGTPTLTIGSSSGTPAVTASAPLSLNTATGNISCPTCGTGSGSVSSVSVVTANGVSGSVATATTTPAITLTLGAITPTTVNGNAITAGTGTLTLGSVTLNAGAGGTLGSNAFTSTAFAPLASPTFTGTVTIPNGGVFGTPTSITLSNATGLPVGGGGTGTATAFTTGSVVFAGASGVYTQDNANLFWDDTNNRLGVANAAPLYPIHVTGATSAANNAAQTANGATLAISDVTGTPNEGLYFRIKTSGNGIGGSSFVQQIVSSGGNGLEIFTSTGGSIPIIFGVDQTERMRLLTGLMIGTTTDPGAGGLRATGATIQFTALASDAATVDNTVCVSSAGTLLKGSGTLGICLGTSGRQFKTAFTPMTAGLDDLMRINFQNYRYREGFGDSGESIQYGTTAQDVEKVRPDLVRHDHNGNAINYDSGALLFIGLHAIQELKAENDNLAARLAKLENRR